MSVQKKLMGLQDAKGMRGILSRGKNVYNSTSNAAHSGGGIQYGRPKGSKTKKQGIYQAAATRKLNMYGKR